MKVNLISDISFESKKRKNKVTTSNFTQGMTNRVKETVKMPSETLKTMQILPVIQQIDKNKSKLNYDAKVGLDSSKSVLSDLDVVQQASMKNYLRAQDIFDAVQEDLIYGFEGPELLESGNITKILEVGSRKVEYHFDSESEFSSPIYIKEYDRKGEKVKREIEVANVQSEDRTEYLPVKIKEYHSNTSSMTYFYNKPLYSTLAFENYEEDKTNWSADRLFAAYGKYAEVIDNPKGRRADFVTGFVDEFKTKYAFYSSNLVEYGRAFNSEKPTNEDNIEKFIYHNSKLKSAYTKAPLTLGKSYIANNNGIIE